MASRCRHPGVAIRRAERDKDVTYPELVNSGQLRLLTLACEIGGRWSDTCRDTVRQLATVKAREAPRQLRSAAVRAWEQRWWALLSVAAQSALASTLVDDAPDLLGGWDGPEPEVVEMLQDALLGPVSRLPLR